MDYPKISIVTPSLNQGAFIEETILSILEQNYPHLEYIIIDGGSTDNTLEIIKKYEKYLYYWESMPDRGQSHAINKGLAKATGDIFNWINSDDYLARGYLRKVGEIFKNPTIQCCCGFAEAFHQNHTKPSYLLKPTIHNTIEANMAYPLHVQPSTFYRKSVFDKFQGVNESLQYCMDRELWIKFHMNYDKSSIHQINCIGSHFRLHEKSKTVDKINGFRQERALIENSLLNYMKAPLFLIKLYEKKNYYNPYTPLTEWHIENIENKKYMQYILKKYMRDNYKNIFNYFILMCQYFTKLQN